MEEVERHTRKTQLEAEVRKAGKPNGRGKRAPEEDTQGRRGREGWIAQWKG